MAPPDDHDCAWKEHAAKLKDQLDEVLEAQRRQKIELDSLKRQLFGKKSEKMPPMDREVRRGKKADPEARKQARKADRCVRHRARRRDVEADAAHHQEGLIWTFIADNLVGYRFSADRSGKTPQRLLGGTQGTLLVDA